MVKEYDLSDQEIQNIFDKYWKEEKTDKKFEAVSNPKGFVLGGQPGAGKSNSIDNGVCQGSCHLF